MKILRTVHVYTVAVVVIALGTFAAHGDDGGIPEPPEDVSVICVEVESGATLFAHNAEAIRPPASMVKMLMMLMVAEGLENGDWSLDTLVPVSRNAQRMGGTQVFLEAGEAWPLGTLMNAVAVASANDAAMAVAEGLWGSAETYLDRANERANSLGMTNSRFYSVHGLPPDPGEEFDRTTARDMALLGRECLSHPQVREWVAQKELVFREGAAAYYNTNKLLWRMSDCDGLKTGYIRAAGFCITATAERDGVRLVAVVMGHRSKYGRFNLAEDVLETGFLLDEKRRDGIREIARLMSNSIPVPPPPMVVEPEPLISGGS